MTLTSLQRSQLAATFAAVALVAGAVKFGTKRGRKTVNIEQPEPAAAE